jgi:hypothetical protein
LFLKPSGKITNIIMEIETILHNILGACTCRQHKTTYLNSTVLTTSVSTQSCIKLQLFDILHLTEEFPVIWF